MQVSTKKRLSPTVTYLLTALVISWPVFICIGFLLPEWGQSLDLSPLSLAALHALILGTMLTVAYGVLYQMVPIAFQAPPLPRHLLYWHLPLHATAVLTMVTGFLTVNFEAIAIGGTILTVNAFGFAYFLQRSYRTARNKTKVHQMLVWPFICFAGAVGFGLWQAFDPSNITTQTLMQHTVLGGLGFWEGLVFVISYKFIPMFALSHGYSASLPRTAALYFSGLLFILLAPLSAGLALALPKWILLFGCCANFLGVASFVIDVWHIMRARKRKRLVLPMIDAFAALSCILTGHTVLLVAIVFNTTAWIAPGAYLLLLGGFVPLIFSYMQKIVPFLWFEYRFSHRPERRTAPLLDEMVPPSRAKTAILLYFASTFLGLVILVFNGALAASADSATFWKWAGLASGFMAAASSVILFTALFHVLTIGGKRPPDEPKASATR